MSVPAVGRLHAELDLDLRLDALHPVGIKIEWPHLLAITDPAVLRAELENVRIEYNTVRLHSGIGYVTPDDEHEGRGEAIRKDRGADLVQALQRRLAHHRSEREINYPEDPTMLGSGCRT